MTLGIMQPYFFPYLGYFSLIKATNKWIVFDTPQYGNRSWINRNRILDPNSEGWIYFTAPVKKHKLASAIYSIEIQNSENWKEKIIAQLGYYRKHAPNYKTVTEFLIETMKDEFDSLSKLNIHTLKACCAYIGIDFNFEIFSEMKLPIDLVQNADEWALKICKVMGVTEYINPERGQLFIQRKKYSYNKINLKFLEYKSPEYDQRKKEFIQGLSIIDAMMFNTPDEINQLLDDYQLVK